MQLTFDTISPYNICADRLGITKTCKPWIATMANWKGKTCHISETPKDISYYIHSKMAELNSSGNFIVESTREYLPDQKKSVPGYKVTWINCPNAEYRDTTIRIIAWHPFPILFYPNFNRILARMLEVRKISYKFPEGHNNAFEEIGISRNIMMQMSLAVIGFLIGFSGLEFFSRSVNRIQMYIHENKISGMSFENKYIRRFLKMSFHVLDAPICVAEKIGNVRVRNWIKITSVLFLSFTIIYITYILAYIFVMVVLALITLAIIIWIIISLLGGSPSGRYIGGGGGSSSGSSNSSTKGSYYEKDGEKYDIKTKERIIKQDGRTYRKDLLGEWNADKDIFGSDEVEKDIFGDPTVEKDIFGDQIVEKDIFGDPIIPPKKKR